MIHNSSVIDKKAKISNKVKIGPFCYVGPNVELEDDVELISYTVDPDRDSVERLREYANSYDVNFNNWNLLTGDQKTIYELGVNGYLVPNQEDALAPGGFLHSEKMILIDQQQRIRGYYDGTDEENISKIVKDIKKLL